MLLYGSIVCFILLYVFIVLEQKNIKISSFFTKDKEEVFVANAMSTESSSTMPNTIVIKPLTLSEHLNVTHIPTPEHVRGLYLSAWGAGSSALTNPIVEYIDNTELNAVVVDVKDYTGQVSFALEDYGSSTEKYRAVYQMGNQSKKITDVNALIKRLHDKNIYVIARIAVFQDPLISRMHPEWAIKDKQGGIWHDKKGLSWINPKEQDYWKYVESLANYAYDIGFDEVNLDYIRFPTDGDIDNMYLGLASSSRAEVINDFYVYMGDAMYDVVPLSADLFGLTTVATDDLGIGQKIESGLKNFNYVAPMIYPSHYGANFEGIKDPDAHPYDTIYKTMKKSIAKVSQLATDTDMEPDYYMKKMRPWIQDFSLHHNYGVNEINAQIKALHDVGIESFLVWNASNRYTKGVGY